jgi:hypothetical protein
MFIAKQQRKHRINLAKRISKLFSLLLYFLRAASAQNKNRDDFGVFIAATAIE